MEATRPVAILPIILTFLITFAVLLTETEGKPALLPIHTHHHELYYQPIIPHASQQTTVVRDFLGNQGTAYAYQNYDGISSSAVAVSRSDNSKTLAYLPAPLVYAHHQYPYSDFNSYVV